MLFKSIASLLVLISAISATPAVMAQQNSTPKQCQQTPDPVGCLLSLAKTKAFSIKDKKEQVAQISKILTVYASLNRTDYELVSRADAAINDKKLDLEKFLDLQMALATYFVQRDPERAKKYERNARLVYFEAVAKDIPKDRAALVTWACGLIDGDALIWKRNAFITTAACTPERVERSEKKDDLEELPLVIQKMNAAWAQSDHEELSKQTEYFKSKLAEYESIGIKRKSKVLNEATQYMKVLVLLVQAEMNRRSGLFSESSKLLFQAIEALNGLEKINESNLTVSARIFLADHHNVFLSFDKSMDTLQPLEATFESKRSLQFIETNTYIDYLTTLATALGKGNISDKNAAKSHINELFMRQADVLYERYLYLRSKDKSQALASESTL